MDKNNLDSIFPKVVKSERFSTKIKYSVVDESGNDLGLFAFDNGYLFIEVINFPGQKKYFESNFPIRNESELAKEFERVGLSLY